MKKLTLILLLLVTFGKASGQIDNSDKMALYGRIWGMIKFYHPTIQKNKINWDTVFVFNYSKFKSATDTASYNKLLKNLLDTVGKVHINDKSYKHFPKDTTICNLDFKWIDNSNLLNSQNKALLTNIIKYYKPRTNKTIEKENIGYDMKEVWQSKFTSYPNEALCMLALFNYWNRINYFFAYKTLMDIPWDKTLDEFIPRIESASGTKEFYLLMAELITRINDGHGWCVNKIVNTEIGTSLFFRTEFVESKTIVSNINDSLSRFLGIKRGDEIIEANGKLISQRRIELDKYIGGSNKGSIELSKNYRILGLKYWGPFNIKIKDTLGFEKNIAFNRDSTFNNKLHSFSTNTKNEKSYKFISENYGYIDAGITTIKDVRKAFQEFASTKAIIIDLRKYGGASTYFYTMHITNKNMPYATLYIGDSKFPGSFEKTVYKTNQFGIAFLQRKYKGQIVVLTDEHTGSGMELMSMCFRATGKVIIIGRNTGGYDGSCKPFLIRPDFGAAYSGDAVFYPNGTQTQRVGIVPDIYVNATFDGVKRGKDEILDRALQYLMIGQ
ncbi:MAG: S41 family peptidase [Bacteroidales bacterium]|nr:S41 family peptidase [Bacteroidales bacterium]